MNNFSCFVTLVFCATVLNVQSQPGKDFWAVCSWENVQTALHENNGTMSIDIDELWEKKNILTKDFAPSWMTDRWLARQKAKKQRAIDGLTSTHTSTGELIESSCDVQILRDSFQQAYTMYLKNRRDGESEKFDIFWSAGEFKIVCILVPCAERFEVCVSNANEGRSGDVAVGVIFLSATYLFLAMIAYLGESFGT